MAAKKVLIVEDDSILAGALAGAVKKAGYESVVSANAIEGMRALDHDSFKAVFIDCMLPEIPGIDFAKNIRKNFDSKMLPIVMMSGIFTDKQMMKEMSEEVSALDFLKKPFEVTDVIKFLEKESSSSNDEGLARSIFSLPDRMEAGPTTANEIVHAVNRIHGYELPILLAVLVGHSYSGVVHLMSEKSEKTKITFSRGSIAAVESPDVQSSLGKLLVANGWVLPEDLENVLRKPSEKRLGQRLSDGNFISPHAIFEVMEEQMALRLAKIIQEENYIVHFEDKHIDIDGPSIDPEEFYIYLDDWICSKVAGDWLNHQLINWQDYAVRLGPRHERGRKEYSAKALLAVKDVIISIENIGVLSSLHQAHKNHLTNFNKAFYFLLCQGLVLFGEKISQMSDAERLVRLQKIWVQMKDLNLIDAFQMIGGRKDMDPAELKTVYADFVDRHLGTHPRMDSNPALASVYESVKTRITEAYNLFVDSNKLISYERDMEAGKANQRSEAQAKMEEAKKFLSMKQYASATIVLNKAAELYPKLDYLALFGAWTKVGLLVNSKNKAKDIAEIDTLIARVPSEERISAIGNFVQGVLAKAKGERGNARKFFEAALALDKNLIEARRELNALPGEEQKKPDSLLTADLGTVIGNLFKKS